MNSILDKIITYKKAEVARSKSIMPIAVLEKSAYFNRPVHSFQSFLTQPDQLGIVAEFKRKSPSKGIINADADVETVTRGYVQAGAAALSVLTDQEFFGGQLTDLTMARAANAIPVLRKDFIVDEYQLVEAKSAGADVVLLIAACLTPSQTKALAATAKNLGLEVLMEIHSSDELDKLHDNIDVLGVNNRDLNIFKTDIYNSVKLAASIPAGQVKISESGIHTPEDLVVLKNAGFDGFLIGEGFMKTDDPGGACAEMIQAAKAVLNHQLL